MIGPLTPNVPAHCIFKLWQILLKCDFLVRAIRMHMSLYIIYSQDNIDIACVWTGVHARTHTDKQTYTPTIPRTQSHPQSTLSNRPGESPQRRWREGELLARKGSPISWLLLHHQMMKMRSFQWCRLLDHWNGNVPYIRLFPLRITSSSGQGNGNPLQYSCLENSTDRGIWQATVQGVTRHRRWLSHLTLSLSIMKDIPVWVATSIQQFPIGLSLGCSSGTSQLQQLQDWIFHLTHWERLFLMFLH